ncbi:MAG TPA: glycosyltransferase, partial [Clostridia bacterium]|nr:glycosyltransferase [Clostridia bacterium]
MKVLHIINGLGAGGAERLISDIIPLMNRKNGVEVEVLLLTDEKNVFKEKLEENGVKVDVVPYRKMYSPLNVFYIRKYIIKGNYDVVHAHLFPTQYWVGLTRVLLKLKGVKFITTEHSSYNRRRTKFYFRYLDRYIYSKYDGVISVSEKVHFNLIEWLKIPKEKLDKFVVINNGINVEKFKQA